MAVTAAPTRQDMFLVSVTVTDPSTGAFYDLGTFDTLAGGEVDSEESKYRPGGMGAEISMGGWVQVAALTVGRYYDRKRDHAIVKTIAALAGRGRVSVGMTPLAPNGKTDGETLTRQGTLKSVKFPEVDSTSADPAMWELEVTCDGGVA